MAPEHNELHSRLGRLEGKIDSVLDNQLDVKRRAEQLETRMSVVEAKVNRWGGGIAVILGIYVFIGEKIRNVLFGS